MTACMETQSCLDRLGMDTSRPSAGACYDHAEQLRKDGLRLFEGGNREEGIALLRQATAIAPVHAQAWNDLGACYFVLGRNDEALDVFEQTLRIAPRSHFAWHNLGGLCLRFEDPQTAIRYFLHALEIMPNYRPALEGYQIAISQIGSPRRDPKQETIKLFQEILRSRAPRDLVLSHIRLIKVAYAWIESLRQEPQYAKAAHLVMETLDALYRDAGQPDRSVNPGGSVAEDDETLRLGEYGDVRDTIQQIDGWLLSDEEAWLFEAAQALPDDSLIVEIGSYKGRSTCCLGHGIAGTRKRIVAIDLFATNSTNIGEYEDEYFTEFCRNVAANRLTEYVRPIRGNSRDVAATWTEPITMLFLDGSHEYEDVLADFNNFFPHVVPGGIVAFHDVTVGGGVYPGPGRVWKEVARRRLHNTTSYNSLACGTKPRA